jgi:hypothetical protein
VNTATSVGRGARFLSIFAGLLVVGCSGTSSTNSSSSVGGSTGGGQSANGGSTGGQSSVTGGDSTAGGHATGGTNASDSRSSGGAVGAGGNPATGGLSATGGSPTTGASGGNSTTGGLSANGGKTATGGTVNSGGSKASGGSSLTGGVTSGGGSKVSGGTSATGGRTSTGGSGSAGGSSATCGTGTNNYDQTILCDHPVGYWAMNKASGSEPDLTSNGHNGTHQGGTVPLVAMPNADQASDFNGSSQYVTIPSNAAFSIPTTGNLTWEGWIRPDVLQFPNDTGGYVDWMGKCEEYSPTCEWEARMYSLTNSESRPNRLSAYAFNPDGDLGSGAFWQQAASQIQAGQWYHVVGQYSTLSQPSQCSNSSAYPGAVSIWVNGVPWNQASHGQTGCMSQYNVVPVANDSAVNVGTMARDAWFQGAVGKVAIYDFLLSQTQITNHYQSMTGKQPTGSCNNTCSF